MLRVSSLASHRRVAFGPRGGGFSVSYRSLHMNFKSTMSPRYATKNTRMKSCHTIARNNSALSAQERAYLERQVRRHRVARSLSKRCRVILRCADGLASKDVAAELGHHEHTIGKWRRRFLKDRCDGLLDEVRPGRPRTIDRRPTRHTGRSVRWRQRLAFLTPPSAGCGQRSACSRTVAKRSRSSDPLFVDKVRDIVGLYLSPPNSPPNRALILCIDEKSQIQALDREQPVLPMTPGVPERRTHSYVRHGTTSLFAALDVASGFVIGKCYKRHREAEFLNFLKEIDAQVPEGLDIHIVVDNYATHKTPKIKAWLGRRPHYHVHFTPTSASWINQVERWFAELTRKRLQRGVHTSIRQLEADIRSFIDRHNQNPTPFKWNKSAYQILASVKRSCHKVQHTLCSEL